MFLSWWYLKANVIFKKKKKKGKKKRTIWDLFMSRLFGQGGGLNISTPLLDYFLSLSWMNESSSVLPFQIFHENTAHHHGHEKKSSTWETSWSVKLESPPPFTHPFGKFYFGERFYELNHLLLLFSTTRQSKWNCSVSTLSSIACLPCITYNAHCLMCPLVS